MKRWGSWPLVVGAVLALLCLGFEVPALGGTDKSIDQFWASFNAAVQKQDKQSIILMSEFPIEMPYGIAKIRNRTQLIHRYRELFNEQTNAAKCFADAQPVVEAGDANRFTVGCKDAAGNEVVVYGFVRRRGSWKLKYLDNVNE
jgi:hypothetical protein